MLSTVIGDLLPSALGVALSPVPIVAIVLLLSSDRARSQGISFAVGWVAALAVVSGLVGVLVSGATTDDDPAPIVALLQSLFGLGFLALAARQWRGRPGPGEEAPTPAWMASLTSLSAIRTAALGAALAGLNPKNLALTAAASATIGQADLGVADAVTAVGAFVLVASASVVGAVILQLVAPRRSAGVLQGLREFMLRHNDAIMLTVLLLLGAKLLGNGLAGL